MATPENTFISSVHRFLPVELYRMKNHNQYNGGIPDVWYSGKVKDLWIEYKFIVLPKRPSTPIVIALSELQKNWLRSRSAQGRNVAVVVGNKDGGVYLNNLAWDYTYTADEFYKLTVPRNAIAAEIVNFCNKK